MTYYSPYPQYKLTTYPWLNEVPEHWQIRRLKFMARIQNGRDYKEVVSNEGFPVIGSGGEFAKANTYLYRGESVLLGRKGTIDRPLYINGPFWTVDTMFYTEIAADVWAKYLYYCALTINFSKYATSTALPSMTQQDLGAIPFAVPDQNEQQAIARFLDFKTAQIDALIAKKQTLLDKLAEKRTALISHAVTKGLDPSAPTKDSGVAWLGDIPAHWVCPPLYSRYTIELGKMLNESRISGNNLIPYLRNIDVQWDAINTQDLPVMDIRPDEYFRYLVCAGDLLVCEGGEVGRAAIMGDDVGLLGFQKALHRLRCVDEEKEKPRFMFYTLCWAANSGLFLAEGNPNTIPHLTGEKLRRYRFPCPPFIEQQMIADWLDEQCDSILKQQIKVSQVIDTLNEYRTALITNAVTGKIDVREWHE